MFTKVIPDKNNTLPPQEHQRHVKPCCNFKLRYTEALPRALTIAATLECQGLEATTGTGTGTDLRKNKTWRVWDDNVCGLGSPRSTG